MFLKGLLIKSYYFLYNLFFIFIHFAFDSILFLLLIRIYVSNFVIFLDTLIMDLIAM